MFRVHRAISSVQMNWLQHTVWLQRIDGNWMVALHVKRTDCIVWLSSTLASLVKQFSATYKYTINVSQYSICNHVKVCNAYDMRMIFEWLLATANELLLSYDDDPLTAFALFTLAVQPWKFFNAFEYMYVWMILASLPCLIVTRWLMANCLSESVSNWRNKWCCAYNVNNVSRVQRTYAVIAVHIIVKVYLCHQMNRWLMWAEQLASSS